MSKLQQAAYEGTLPPWQITKMPHGQIGIECTRKDCRGKAIVNKRKWLDSRPQVVGRSCTYCFRTNRIP